MPLLSPIGCGKQSNDRSQQKALSVPYTFICDCLYTGKWQSETAHLARRSGTLLRTGDNKATRKIFCHENKLYPLEGLLS